MVADRAIGLVRVSQRDGDTSEHSPEVQLRGMVKHAQDAGITLDPRDIYDENVDTNGKVRKVSGSWDLSDRPELAAAIDAVEAGTHQVIMAERFDRLFRNLDVQREVIQRIEVAGGRLETVKQGAISHATAEAELHANIDGMIAQYQRRTAKDRAWDAVEVAIEQGKMPGPIPLGYARAKNGGLIPADDRTVKIVQEAFQRRADGATSAEVRAFLASKGIKRSIAGTRKMLGSKLYVGELHYGKHTPNLASHEAIIDRELFDRVQKMVVSAGRLGKSERLLARQRLLRCGTCGGRMSVSGTGSGYAIYRCTSDDCSRPVTISAEPIEKAVIERVIEYRRSFRGQARGEQKARDAQETAEQAEDRLQKTILLLEDFGDMEATHQKLAVLREDAERKREAADRLAAAYPPVVTVDVEAVFDRGTLEEKRSVIRNTVERITIAPGRGPQRITIDLLGQ